MSTAFEIHQTQERLAELHQQAAAAKREATIEKLKFVRVELREKTKEFERLKRQIERNEADRIEQRRNVRYLEEKLAQSISARPQIFLFIPEDPACVTWQKSHAKIEAMLDTARQKLFAIPASDFGELTRLGGAVQSLQFAERNLLNLLTDDPNPQKHFQIATGVNEAR